MITSIGEYPSHTMHSYYSIIDYILYAVLYIPMTTFITGNLNLLITFTFFTHSSNHPPHSDHQFVICVYEFVSILFVQKGVCTPTFNATLFTITNIQKQSKCPPIDKWIKMMWYIRDGPKWVYSCNTNK